ncbi:efflux RND transporter periplasmic adaptor subunit [Aeromonas veronii]|uniref:efflux RND transporter periplasmic adaptor subunit n=1 Tax=Aeromonas TaxID=642 RepID=UPI001A8DDE8F|nr:MULTISPECIES: efflux RND transporter periplasmic adaptor subunit [Aeromonas]EKP0304739.1 efflux RND transporter periplasmic adaptor subunit [Aeromonas veronii]MBO0400364.1 efflux RND transporter periplasmic adaptor subunit [Aeromonas veronii]MCF5718763.1 efflux RND transporter periplasmic adaptor subunit [Aeromonas veronii]MCF5861164.1 efflux RND transporter periplasmic adaptor subunit [Aeromonas veronii]MCO5344522.1 efflux RND transporter periplasmic adaptor subunit [Aeromonas veronii]
MMRFVAMLLVFLAGGGSVYLLTGLKDADTSKEKQPLYWVNPMDPQDKRQSPAKDSMGMDFIPIYEEKEQVKGSAGTVTITPEIQQNLGVRLDRVKRVPTYQEIETVGYVGYDEDRLEAINSRMAGWVRTLAIKSEGQRITKGSFIYALYAPDLVNAQHEYLLAMNSNNPLLIRAAEGKLKALQIPNDQISILKKTRKVSETISFYAPNDGYVSDLKIREGQYVEPAEALFNISTLEQVWVSAEIFERQADLFKIGDPVTMTLGYAPSRTWVGKVDYLYPTLDASTRTFKVRLRFDNPDEFLKPNMFAQLNIKVGGAQKNLVVPNEAVIKTGSQNRVVLSLGDGRFKSVEVTLGSQLNEYIVITSGVEEGDEIVRSAQFLLDSESSINSDFQRMTAFRPTQVWVNADIVDIGQSRLVTIAHQQVPEWQWPAMRMSFELDNRVDLSSLKIGQSVSVQLRQDQDRYLISDIKDPIAKIDVERPVFKSDDSKNQTTSDPQMDHSKHGMTGMDEKGVQK